MSLENFLDEVQRTTQKITNDLNYLDFGYEDEEIFNDDLIFLLENAYNIKMENLSRERIDNDWNKKIRERFTNKCVVSGSICSDYLEACHLIELRDKENYDLDNGILLTSNLHKQFDNNKWCINPETYCVKVKEGVIGDILKYNGKKLDLPKTYLFKYYLKERYKKFEKTSI
jgi:hypothetical protein